MSETAKIREQVINFIKKYFNFELDELRLADLGCGDDKLHPACVGVDRRRVGPHIDLVADVQDLSSLLEEKCFDVVYSSHTLEDCKDTYGVLAEWFRLVDDGGLLILYLPHRDYYPNIGHPLANKAHKHDFIPEDVIAVMDKLLESTKEHLGEDAELVLNEVHAPPNNIYDYENRANIEYSFLLIWRKSGEFKKELD